MAEQRGVIYAFTGAKGGTGKTTLAVNLAAVLARTRGKRVVLLDFNFAAGSDVAHMLNLTPKPHLGDLLPEIARLTPAGLEKYLILHRSGPHLLVKPDLPLGEGMPNCGQVEKILHLARYNFDFILVDCGQGLEERQLAVFHLAREIILIGESDLLALKSLTTQVERLQGAGIPLARLFPVINKVSGRGGLTPTAMAAMLPFPVRIFLPEDAEMTLNALISGIPFVMSNPNASLSRGLQQMAAGLGQKTDGGPVPVPELRPEGWQALKNEAHRRVLAEIRPQELSGVVCETPEGLGSLRQKVERQVARFLQEQGQELGEERRLAFLGEILDDILGLGPLEELLRDEGVTEILVNGLQSVYVERNGRLEKTRLRFHSREEIYRIIERIVTPLGRRIDESMPMVDARLPDGSRVNAVIAPVALDGPFLSIRKFSRRQLTVQDLLRLGTLSEEMARFLAGCIQSKKNLLISGGAGSGKTTTLNVLSSFIPSLERIITIEDAAELRLQQEHVVRLEARPANVEGKGEITIRQLVRNALRMRPDRLVVGEVRGEEVWDMLQAMNTGHSGSLSTCHANSPRDMLVRLEGMVLMSGLKLPLPAIRAQIASAVDLLVHQERLRDGRRKIVQIVELEGLAEGEFVLRELFAFQPATGEGREGFVKKGEPSFPVPIVPLVLESSRGVATEELPAPEKRERSEAKCTLH